MINMLVWRVFVRVVVAGHQYCCWRFLKLVLKLVPMMVVVKKKKIFGTYSYLEALFEVEGED